MRYTCKAKSIDLVKTKDSSRDSRIVVTSSKNNTRIYVLEKGTLTYYTSSGRKGVYKGYERRLGIAIYTSALAFGKKIREKKAIRKTVFTVITRGFNKNAIRGLLDSGLLVCKIKEVLNPPFNGCRKKKKRRL